MSNLPTGTVTFLFTDIEGSTKRWEQYPQQMRSALARHDEILRSAIEANGGYVFKTMGDAFCVSFSAPTDGMLAALSAQRALHSEEWPTQLGVVKVRMALHTGEVSLQEGDYFGPPVNRVARILSAGHGGQTLLSEVTYGLVRDGLPSGLAAKDMGEHRLKDLFRPERIFQLVASGLPSEFPPLRTLDNRPNNLPLQPTPFIGREKVLASVVALFRRPDVHLVTLTGPGGTGKTRLALQAAAELLDDFPDGVYSVELAALTDPSLVPSSIAQVLGVMESGGKPIIDNLKDYLREKRLLLVLDNFEQVTGAASVVDTLSKSAPHLKIMVTSRVNLRLYGEHAFPVPPFELPDPQHLPSLERLTQYEAVRLFIERAQAAKPDFEVTNENAPAVAEICVRLDGLPLAIELAAARVRLFPPQAMLSRLSSRLKMLTGGAVNVAVRQQTLRGTIDWSYDLLTEGHRQLFRRMSVFQGGRTLQALEEVCNYDGELQVGVFDGVETLLSNSLIQQREGTDGEPRFWVLETIHEYAREKLGESGEEGPLQSEHALYFMRLSEEAEPHLTGGGQQEWLGRLEEEHENLRTALRWAREKGGGGEESGSGGEGGERAEIGLRTGGATYRFWEIRGYLSEGREELERLLTLASLHTELQQPPEPLPTLQQALQEENGVSQESREREREGAEAHKEGVREGVIKPGGKARGLEVAAAGAAGAAGALGKVLNGASRLASIQSDYSAARSLGERARSLGREIGDKEVVANSLNNLGNVAYMQGEYAGARALQEESLALSRELGNKSGIALSLLNLGIVAYMQGEYAGARAHYEESLALSRKLGNKSGITLSLLNLGIVTQMQGEYAGARAHYEESLALSRELGNKSGIANSLLNLGNVAYMQREYAGARALFEESLALRREIGNKGGIAASLGNIGNVEYSLGEYLSALSMYRESLSIAWEVGHKYDIAWCLGGMGGALAQLGLAEAEGAGAERGTRLLGAAEVLLEAIGAVLDPEDRIPYEGGVACALAQLGEEAFERARQVGRAMGMEQAIEYALEQPSK